MTSLLDKLIVFMLCATLYLTNTRDTYAVVLVLAAIIFAALESYADGHLYHLSIFFAFLIFCLFVPNAAFFLPLFAYDICCTKWQWFIAATVIPASHFLSGTQFLSFVLLLSFIFLSCILRYRTIISEKKQIDNNRLRDEITEKQLQLEKANRDLLEKQDYEVHLATLKERNRIAGELHDSIGHVLTSSLLQTGALLATCKDESAKENLTILQNSLSAGMDEVRASIHNLHDDSFDLYDEIENCVKKFTFCPVALRYNVDTPPDKKIRYAFLSILKESLANTARHSSATEVHIVVFEHPALYQLIIRDNGSRKSGESVNSANNVLVSNDAEGMGLPGIRQRIENLGGNVVFRQNHGFEVFVSVPKDFSNSDVQGEFMVHLSGGKV